MQYSNTTGHAIQELLTDYSYCEETQELGENRKKKEKWKREEPEYPSDQEMTSDTSKVGP